MTDLPSTAWVYGLRELARRAGVQPAQFAAWRIERDEHWATVYPSKEGLGRLRFPLHPRSPDQALHDLPSARFEWPDGRHVTNAPDLPNLVVPFVEGGTRGPLFRRVGAHDVDCACDLPFSALLTLSRWEETLQGPRDRHGRFPATGSVAARDGFLDRPVVDEWGMGLEQALRWLLPSWMPARPQPSVYVTHDIDLVGIPWNPREAIGHAVRRGRPLAALRDLAAPLTGARPTFLELVDQIVGMSLERGLRPATYWKASAATAFDSGYDIHHPQVRRMISILRERGVECGVHPGYDTFESPDRLKAEVNRLRRVLGDGPLGGRQHYLRWSPESWHHWDAAGLHHDSSVGFADRAGFRAGTCWPYRPWLLAAAREATVVEVPLIVMDTTLSEYQHLSSAAAHETVRALLTRCAVVGGVFTVLWHNNSLVKSHLTPLDGLLDLMRGFESFRPDRP